MDEGVAKEELRIKQKGYKDDQWIREIRKEKANEHYISPSHRLLFQDAD